MGLRMCGLEALIFIHFTAWSKLSCCFLTLGVHSHLGLTVYLHYLQNLSENSICYA